MQKGDQIKYTRENITVYAVIEDIRENYGHTEYNLQPLNKGVEIKGWVRKL